MKLHDQPPAALAASGNPFVQPDFLQALQDWGCVSPELGWSPCHFGDDQAAAPLYVKGHSYGEFVFDFSWAQASQRLGEAYYPKLLCAVPFIPSVGKRLVADTPAARLALAEGLKALVDSSGMSSLHCLFVDEDDAKALRAAGFIERHDTQAHWLNASYASFEAFLAELKQDKRKNILRERRRQQEQGLHLQWAQGDALSESQWHRIHDLYAHTYHQRGQEAYLSREFWLDYGRRPNTPVRVVQAYQGKDMVAAALFWQWGDTLYGRHWGCDGDFHSLHFEACYYQGIEYAIQHGLKRFDAGTQGLETKLLRGFVPLRTRSFHYLRNPRLHGMVERFCQQEREAVHAMNLPSAFKP